MAGGGCLIRIEEGFFVRGGLIYLAKMMVSIRRENKERMGLVRTETQSRKARRNKVGDQAAGD